MATIEDLFRDVGEALIEHAPDDWDRLTVLARILDDFAEACFYFQRVERVEELFSPGMDGFDQIVMPLRSIRKLMKKPHERSWTRVRFELARGGEFSVKYAYEPDDEHADGVE